MALLSREAFCPQLYNRAGRPIIGISLVWRQIKEMARLRAILLCNSVMPGAFTGQISGWVASKALARPVIHQLIPHGIQYGESGSKRQAQKPGKIPHLALPFLVQVLGAHLQRPFADQ